MSITENKYCQKCVKECGISGNFAYSAATKLAIHWSEHSHISVQEGKLKNFVTNEVWN